MTAEAAQKPKLSDRLRNAYVGTRNDLEVSRHLFRGTPSYVIRDPITFHSYRLGVGDYRLLAALDRSCSLGETFEKLVATGALNPDDQERFFEFVLRLHRQGFLQLPVCDDEALYKRFKARRKAATRQSLMSWLFLRVPLWNPDDFLTHTVKYARPVFTRWFFGLWLALQAMALMLVFTNWRAFTEPLNGILSSGNLPLMWVTLILLKVFHEFGHAYACKCLGANVLEMGTFIIAGTPCAYVDASAAWGLPNRMHRLVIGLAGMYLELLIAALAVLVWSMTDPGLLHDICYNVIFLASIVTVLFNLNPLMRYDGYYLFSDLMGVPNLRERSIRTAKRIAKRWCLGVPYPGPHDSPRMLLTAYGVAAPLYRVVVMVGIGTLLATKFKFLGLVIAIVLLGSMLLRLCIQLLGYLWGGEETAPVRRRAILASAAIVGGVPAGLAWIPLQSSVHVPAVLCRERQVVVRLSEPGLAGAPEVNVGDRVDEGTPLLTLVNVDLQEQWLEAEAAYSAGVLRMQAHEAGDPAAAKLEGEALAGLHARRDRQRSRLAGLHVTAPLSGQVVSCLPAEEYGRFLQDGAAVATIVAGPWQARTLLSEKQVTATAPSIGDRVRFRARGAADCDLAGTITRITPQGSRTIPLANFTQLGGGEIAVHPDTGEAQQPFYEIVITLDTAAPSLLHGMSGKVLMSAHEEPLGRLALRRIIHLLDTIFEA